MTTLFDLPPEAPTFPGSTFDAAQDSARLQTQAGVVFECMKSGAWLTLREIEEVTHFPQASISARLRGFARWCARNGKGRWEMSSRRRSKGTWEYRCVMTEGV